MDDRHDGDAPRLVLEQRLPAAPEQVWRALSDPALREAETAWRRARAASRCGSSSNNGGGGGG